MAHPTTDLLDPGKIKANLKTHRIGKEVLVFSSTSSTNDIAAEYAKNTDNDGLAIFAEEQTAGRGRTPNKWLANRSDSILCSVVLIDCKLNPELLSVTAAVAVVEAIGQSTKIKWPNDIILNGKKLAGILLESKPNNAGNTHIIGVGINCHQNKESFPAELRPIATSIDIESSSVCDRISLAKRLLTSLDHWLQIVEQNSDKVTAQWCNLSVQLGHRVKLICSGAEFTGNCIGIDPEKGLTLQLDSGGVRFFPAAHSTILRQA